jgi:hypothetical protein
VESRAVDDSINLETPSDATSYTVLPSSNLTIFSQSATPAVANTPDNSPVEVGVKFVSADSGKITGIRFYKGSQNTGTHIGDLWSSSGQLLASATFANETASGWQQVNFTTPVQIQAGETYIASYWTSSGYYSTTNFFFDNSGTTNGALTATGSGLNGVYAYGSGPIFPNNVSFANGDNYWVDVVFADTSTGPQANADSGFTVTENGSITIAASTLLANDTDTYGLALSLTGVSGAVNGSVSYNAQTQTVTFTPTANYAGPASFLYTIQDTSGATATGAVSLNVAYPVTAQSLFGTNATPAQVNSNDGSAVELGVKFTASTNGFITGLRFYKGVANVGSHIADLWSSTGQLLATATFTNETSSGWEEVNFSKPVAITAGATYVAAYHTNGYYSDTSNYFTTAVTNGDLTAPTAGNGVYSYGSNDIFPTSTYKATNYWVDVVFNGSSAGMPPIASNDSGFVTAENTALNIAASALLANDTDPNGLTLSISGVSSPANGTVSYNAQTQTVTFTPTTGYTGPASFTYTITDTNGGTASANVALTVNAPPVANNDSGFSTTPNTALSISASALLANDSDPAGLVLSLTGVSNPVNGTVSYNAQTQTVTFTPTAGYTGPASFTYSIADTDGGTASANVALTVSNSTAPTESLFSPTSTPSIVTVNDPSAVELGVKFTAAANGQISGIRFYKGPSNTGTHVADLWSSTGTLLATATFTGESASGWQQVNFSTPVAITAGATYVAAYHTNTGEYSANGGYFTSNVVSGDLTAPASGNGVYAYGATDTFPTSSYNSTNYWVDVVYEKTPQTLAPVANNDGGFVTTLNTALTINASQLLANDTDPNGLTMSITGVSSPVNGTVSYNSQTQTVTFTPTSNFTGAASFNYSITDANGGTSSADVALTVNDPNAVSLFSASSTPSIVSVNDPNAVELGVKFTSSQNGEITGIRFYKGLQNTGTHVADLWSSTGTLLATATFTNETVNGWQEADFATPVNITAGTTYVASYHTNTGDYSADPNLLSTAVSNGPLTAPSSSTSGGNGVYAYGGSSLFPTNTYNATSYGVDVLFKAQLAA